MTLTGLLTWTPKRDLQVPLEKAGKTVHLIGGADVAASRSDAGSAATGFTSASGLEHEDAESHAASPSSAAIATYGLMSAAV